MTEPDGGSDFLGAMRTRAVRDGDDYVINGAKMWITNANVADVAVVYAKTDPAAGHKGVDRFPGAHLDPGFRGHPGAVPRARKAHADELGGPPPTSACRRPTCWGRRGRASPSP